MIQKELKELIKQMAQKYKKPEHVIEEIYMSQFQFLKATISDPKNATDLKTISLPKWGKYILSKGKLKWIEKHKQRIENESNNKIDSESNTTN